MHNCIAVDMVWTMKDFTPELLKEMKEYFSEVELPSLVNYPESFKYYLRVFQYAKCGTIEKRPEKT